MDKLHIAIRSYKRAGKITSLDLFKDAYIWVPESQYKDYAKYYDESKIISIPDEEDGNSAKKLNAILNRNKSRWLLIIDDDLTDICYFEEGVICKLTSENINEMIEHYFQIAEGLNVKLWGLNQNSDPLSYRTYNPVCFLSPVLAPFSGHINTKLRYDEHIELKEDYDFWLQNIHKYRKTFRVNKYFYKHHHGSGISGGLLGTRSMDYETLCFERLQKKWGSKVVGGYGGYGGGKKKQNILNTNVKVPIAGV